MEDIPLDEQKPQQDEQQQEPVVAAATVAAEVLPEQVAAITGTETVRIKSHSLKRFFKMGKKGGTQSEPAIQMEARASNDGNEASAAGGGVVESSGLEAALEGKDLRSSVRRRFHLRLRSPQKITADANPLEPVGSSKPTPAPNLKPTLKSSLSMYWHNLFKRHQSSSSSAINATEAKVNNTAGVAEGIAQAVTSAADAAELGEAGALRNLPISAGGNLDDKSGNTTVDGIEELQVLAISDEVEEDQHELAAAAVN